MHPVGAGVAAIWHTDWKCNLNATYPKIWEYNLVFIGSILPRFNAWNDTFGHLLQGVAGYLIIIHCIGWDSLFVLRSSYAFLFMVAKKLTCKINAI